MPSRLRLRAAASRRRSVAVAPTPDGPEDFNGANQIAKIKSAPQPMASGTRTREFGSLSSDKKKNSDAKREPEKARTVRNSGQVPRFRGVVTEAGWSDRRAGKASNQGTSQSRAVKPTTTNVARHPQCFSIHGTSSPSMTSPVRVPKSNRPEGNPRSDRAKSRLTIFEPPGR